MTMENQLNGKNQTPFSGLLLNNDPEELDKKIAEMQAASQAFKNKVKEDLATKKAEEKERYLKELTRWEQDMAVLDEVGKFAEKFTIQEAKNYATERMIMKRRISDINKKYGVEQTVVEESQPVENTSISFWPTVSKVAILLLVCLGIVLFSGDWILDKYPNAATYNEVSFQKVLFSFPVFICGFVPVLAALYFFFPGIGRYFNPFNQYSFDFYNDFKSLSEWQRSIISLALFISLFLAWVMIVSGKLD